MTAPDTPRGIMSDQPSEDGPERPEQAPAKPLYTAEHTGAYTVTHIYSWDDPTDFRNGAKYLSDRVCVEPECKKPAGTAWSPLWCQACNAKRINRVTAEFAAIAARMKAQEPTP